ncbi:MAG: TrpB-like pyridoxal-phosphate dependent enzyme [Thermoplasmatales archaeon SG8-52-3]|nr:MAG: TrpB-like pyridoxal-phosphate dependent enzyme [Thermoplasmatales archaeon SG8-52-3]
MPKTKIVLDENEMPKKWYNIQADLKTPLDPPLNPQTKQPIGPDDLKQIFPMGLIKQEVSNERYIQIPEKVREIYRLWRPTPLYRALKLEKALKTPAKIYYKWEGVSPPGSHKPNSAVAQAYYNMKEGIEQLVTETGAGQWGSALSFASRIFNLKCRVYMVKCSYEQKPYRRILMENWGAEVLSSPTNITKCGREILKKNPKTSGSLGISISEAVEDAATHENTNYALGSVLNHVVLHQTIIGLELKKQFEILGEYPDIICGCVGGGSNFAGTSFPFLRDKLIGKKPNLKIISVEPLACPTLTKGEYRYDFGDTAGLTPLLKMYTLGHSYVPPAIHAGGLRYHGDSPLLSKLTKEGYMDAIAYYQKEVFEAATLFARTEGFIVAPETAHAVRAAIDLARMCKYNNEKKVIVFGNSGHGHFDLSAYEEYHSKNMHDYSYPKVMIKNNHKKLPVIKEIIQK